MDLRKYSIFISKELAGLLSDIEKGIGIEVSELPPKKLIPQGARFLIREGTLIKEWIKLNDGEYHLLGGSGSGGGADAREIELQKSATHIQWRYEGEIEWTDLVALSEIAGTAGTNGIDGVDGREIQLRVDSGYIQWKYVDEVVWTNLVALVSLKGDAGQSIDHISFTSTTAISGLQNEPGETDTYTAWGDVVETINLGTFNVYNGTDGTNGINGVDGASAFVYIAYASDASGTDFTLTFDAALDYIAILSTTIEIVSPVVGNFAGLWKNYKGTAGTDGEGVPPGGTTGQALVKASNTNYDTEWATIVAGLIDIAYGWITEGTIDVVSPTYPEVTYTITPS